jgi:hypothetical protein
MKKVKLMLVSLTVLAVVGGALAFTAKQGDQFCTAEVDALSSCPAEFCPDLASITPTTDPIFLCSTPSVNNGCVVPGTTNPLPCAGTVKRSIAEQ